jgi:hypothetical protein
VDTPATYLVNETRHMSTMTSRALGELSDGKSNPTRAHGSDARMSQRTHQDDPLSDGTKSASRRKDQPDKTES